MVEIARCHKTNATKRRRNDAKHVRIKQATLLDNEIDDLWRTFSVDVAVTVKNKRKIGARTGCSRRNAAASATGSERTTASRNRDDAADAADEDDDKSPRQNENSATTVSSKQTIVPTP